MCITVENRNTAKEIFDWVFSIGIAVAIGLLLVTFVGQRTIVHDVSMEPNLHEGNNLIVEKVSARFGWLHRGDIVVLDSPGENRQLIKRLIAFAGEKVEVKDGKVFINGKELKEKYLKEDVVTEPRVGTPQYSNMTVPEGMVYVLGDNRPASLDSRAFGPVDAKTVRGRAILRFYPFNKFGKLN